MIVILFTLVAFPMQAQNLYKHKLHPVSTPVYDELAPVMIREGLIYTTNRPTNTLTNSTDARGKFPSDIYLAVQDEEGKWSDGEIYSEKLHFPQHDAVASFSLNEDLVFFTRTFEALPPKGIKSILTGKITTPNPNSGLFFSAREGEEWSEVQEFPHNQ
ncbi:MAG: hypothetical protein ACOCUP_00635, partial [bacterium]